MTEKILFVDDEPNVLSGYQRELRKKFDVETATSAEEGLRIVAAHGPFAVIVSDYRMPQADGNRFLAAVKKIAPDSVRVMLTGYADIDMAMRAINDGSVFRLLTKPCAADILSNMLTAAVQQYRLVTAEKELLENTLRSSIKVLTELLGLVNPQAFGRTSRIKNYVRRIAEQMELPNVWQLETAALLSQIGCVIFPESLLKNLYNSQQLSEEESQLYKMHPGIGSSLIAGIPRMEEITEIIKYQEKHFDGTGSPRDSLSGAKIPVGAKILKIALDFDVLEAAGIPAREALKSLKLREGYYDPQILAAVETALCVEGEEAKSRLTVLRDLKVDMVLDEDVLSETGLVLIAKGQEVSLPMLVRLQQFAKASKIREPFRVRLSGGME